MPHRYLGIDPETNQPWITFDLELPNNLNASIHAKCDCCDIVRACIPVTTSHGKRYVWCGACSAGLMEVLTSIRPRVIAKLMGLSI